MKRLCTLKEKEILYNNKDNICMGSFYQSADSGSVMITLFLSLFIWLPLLFGSIPFVVDWLSRTMFYLWMILLLFLSRLLTNFLYTRIKALKDKKAFLSSSQLFINGATIINVDSNSIYYIEDNEIDDSGYPYIVKCPMTSKDMFTFHQGDRVIILYQSDNTGESGQLMKQTASLTYMINENSDKDLSKIDLNTLEVYPHPACRYIRRTPWRLSEEEKNAILHSKFFTDEHRSARIIMRVCLIILFLCTNLIIVVLSIEESWRLPLQLMIYCINNMFIILFGMFIFKLRNRTERKMFCTDFVSEVVFLSANIGKNYSQSVTVYEWKDNCFQEITYYNCYIRKVKTGDILYKYNNGKRITFLLHS